MIGSKRINIFPHRERKSEMTKTYINGRTYFSNKNMGTKDWVLLIFGKPADEGSLIRIRGENSLDQSLITQSRPEINCEIHP